MELVNESAPPGSEASAVGFATLIFLTFGSIGAAASGGLSEPLAPAGALAVLAGWEVLLLLAGSGVLRAGGRDGEPHGAEG